MDQANLSLYHQVLGEDFFLLSPLLREIHGSAGNLQAKGVVEVTYGKGILVKLMLKLMKVPRQGKGVDLRLEVVRSAGVERWFRIFDGVPLKTIQTAKNSLLLERLGNIVWGFRLAAKVGKLEFNQVFVRIFGVKMPKWMGVMIYAIAEERENSWHIRVETSSPLLGLLFRYDGIIQSEV